MEIEAGQLIQYLIQAIIVLLLILLIKMLKNGGSKNPGSGNPGNGKPGKATICIERGEKIQEHDTKLENLIKDMDEEKRLRGKFREEMLNNFKEVFSELRKIKRPGM